MAKAHDKSAATTRPFTPVDHRTGIRLQLLIEKRELRRGPGKRWKAEVVDLKTGKRYRAWSKSCGIPGCLCDAYAEEIASPAAQRREGEMRKELRGYFNQRPEDKIRLAMAILYDVCNDWDNDAVEHYPEGLPSFDEYLSDIGSKLYAIRWK